VHQFKPEFREAALLEDSAMVAVVKALNQQITSLAPVLNSPSLPDAATVKSENPAVPVDFTVKRQAGVLYLFAVAMRNNQTTATFTLNGVKDSPVVEVIGEDRTLTATNGAFADSFQPWEVHLYRIR
jgi:hypothetical protein